MNNLPKITSQIVWLYYDDLDKLQEFYEGVMGFELITDQGLARIYRVTENSYIGTVDGVRGIHPVREESSVAIAFGVNDVTAWYEHLVANNVKIRKEPRFVESIQIEAMLAEDPGGYVIEIQRFATPELVEVFHPSG